MANQTLDNQNLPTVVIIGAGIIGLTCALRIQAELSRRSHNGEAEVSIAIVAREWPSAVTGAPATTSPNYASMWAGAHVRPIPADTPQLVREAKWFKHTASEFERQVLAEPWVGITRTVGRELLEAPSPTYRSLSKATFKSETGLSGYRQLEMHELPKGVELGFEYQTYCINSPIYCANLLRKFLLAGGKTVQRELTSELEVFDIFSNVQLVVNASGIGFGDPKSFPTRGQIVLTNLSHATETITRQNKDGTWSFIIPRFFGGGTVIGGTKEPNNWSVEPSVATRERLLSSVASLDPALLPSSGNDTCAQPLRIIADVVGRRPTRDGGMRIEAEKRYLPDLPAEQGARSIVHAYGAGGRGYELSWGIAQEVTELTMKNLGAVLHKSPQPKL
ncbi:hypothetical protein BX600DRAFT_60484 [Xylariales sp. PMI_506]|nr:hypothetical protein BX600DRAFT_60484 [Xylariales sp. PMI_506]